MNGDELLGAIIAIGLVVGSIIGTVIVTKIMGAILRFFGIE